jgi:cholesterol oxidase
VEPYVPTLSKDWSLRRDRYDFVIVGSGYGGSIMAARLASADPLRKPSVCLLERGKEWPLAQLPDTFDAFLANVRGRVPFRNGENPLGLYDIVNATDITVLKGNGLGGTSLVNANVAIVPEDAAFQRSGWPASLNARSLAPFYARAAGVLKLAKLPCTPGGAPCDQQPRKRLALEKRAKQLGMHTELCDVVVNFEDLADNGFGVAQPKCTRCGDCITGCRVGAKNTLYMNYLPWAWRNGAEIFTQTEVLWLEPVPGGGWLVHGVHRPDSDSSQPFALKAADVVLAAGALNSPEILLRSAAHGLPVTPHVGSSFSGNGDFFGISYNGADFLQVLGFGNHPESPGAAYPPGPTITTKLQYRSASDPATHFLFEDVSFPSALRQNAQQLFPFLLGEDFGGDPAVKLRRELLDIGQTAPFSPDGALNHSMLYLAMAFDNAQGRIVLKTSHAEPEGKADIVWHGAGTEPIFKTMDDELRQHARALGGRFIENPTWSFLGLKHLITAHPLGGCPIGADHTQGAANQFGEVYASDGSVLEGLLVVDGSLVPGALAVNPLFTISALAEWIAEHQIRKLAGRLGGET